MMCRHIGVVFMMRQCLRENLWKLRQLRAAASWQDWHAVNKQLFSQGTTATRSLRHYLASDLKLSYPKLTKINSFHKALLQHES